MQDRIELQGLLPDSAVSKPSVPRILCGPCRRESSATIPAPDKAGLSQTTRLRIEEFIAHSNFGIGPSSHILRAPPRPLPSMSTLKTTLVLLASALPLWLSAAPRIEILRQPSLWQRAQFAITGLPAANNPFDPDEIAVDAEITTPSGKHQRVPAFWSQGYSSALVAGTETLTPHGQPGWQLRYTPTEPGDYAVALQVLLNRQEDRTSATSLGFHVNVGEPAGLHGWVRVTADKRGFETTDGRALRLIGENVCWAHEGGTHDYEEWFSAMAASGQNFARLWMAPWWGGIEHKPGTLTRYDLGAAWRIDRVFDLAEQKGLYVMLCLDHHGMYQIANKNWGGTNNFWATSNPYSTELGGPCAKPNDFFASPEARKAYAKRLRYLVARYGSSPALHSWQFFNEIDNVWRFLKEDDVLSWHREMAAKLRAIDPYAHLITTSLTGSSDRASVWSMKEMDFAIYHSYGEASLAAGLASRSAEAFRRYEKPYLIGEFGVSAAAWHQDLDPYQRGFRQALWGGALGGSAGTAMSWWWEDIHAARAYPAYRALHEILHGTGWDKGTWIAIEPEIPCPRPQEVAKPFENADAFTASLRLQGSRSSLLPNAIALSDPLAAERAAESISAFLHGSRHPELRMPHRLSANLAEKARLNFRVRQVGGSARILVKVDDETRLREALGASADDNPAYQDIGKDYCIDLPAGHHLVEIANEGVDWIVLERLQIEGVLPSELTADWDFMPELFGLRQQDRAILYAVSPQVVWPANSTQDKPVPCPAMKIQIADLASGTYEIRYLNPATGAELSRATGESDGRLMRFPLPEFTEDLAIVLLRQP